MVKISDIAKLADVSSATVSRVLNGTANVSSEKKERVLSAISETGYKPNEIARSLYKKSSRIIGYVVPSVRNIFLNEIGCAIESEAFGSGYKVILCNTDESAEKESQYIEMLMSMNADGIIIMSNNDMINEEIEKCRIPVVVLDQKADTDCSAAVVQSDNRRGGFMAAEHLVKCGCRQIVQMRGPQKYLSGVQRFEGYIEACEKYGMEPHYVDAGYDFESGIDSAKEILRLFPNADGILASSDMTALSLYKVLFKRGRRVPDDVMIVGYDGLLLSRLMTPEFTTVVQPMEKIGKLAAGIIIDMVNGKKNINACNILPVSLKVRQTTKQKIR